MGEIHISDIQPSDIATETTDIIDETESVEINNNLSINYTELMNRWDLIFEQRINSTELIRTDIEVINEEDILKGTYEPNESFEINGKKYYTDDNGHVYRVNDSLLPNSTYEINGYKYVTDEKGRIISAEGVLQKKNHEGRPPIKDSMDKIGKGDQKSTDDRGHLIGDQFNGGNGLENIVPMDSELNEHGDFKKLEQMLADAVKDGAEVYIKIEPVYEGDSNRPVGFRITYSIDGDVDTVYFKNGSDE